MSLLQEDRADRIDILFAEYDAIATVVNKPLPEAWAHGRSKHDAEDLLDWLENQGPAPETGE